jgi:sodium/potassium-transporting ATPase subunit alpha
MTVQHCWYDDELHDMPAPRNLPEYNTMMADKDAKGALRACVRVRPCSGGLIFHRSSSRLPRSVPCCTGFHGWTKFDPENATFRMLHKVASICNNSEFVLANNSLDPAAGLLDLGAEWQKSECVMS